MSQLKAKFPSSKGPSCESCWQCRHWINCDVEMPDVDGPQIRRGGQCRRYPPSAGLGGFPYTRENDWCGEYNQRIERRPEPEQIFAPPPIPYPVATANGPDLNVITDQIKRTEDRTLHELRDEFNRLTISLHKPQKKAQVRPRIFGLLVDHVIVCLVVAGATVLIGLVRLQFPDTSTPVVGHHSETNTPTITPEIPPE